MNPTRCSSTWKSPGCTQTPIQFKLRTRLPSGEIESWLIRPGEEWPEHWDYNAEDMHQISRRLLFEVGRPCQEIARRMNEKLAGETLYSNYLPWDRAWLLMIFETADCRPAFDIRDVTVIMPGHIASNPIRWKNLQEEAWRRVGGRRHRANDDVPALREFYRLVAGR